MTGFSVIPAHNAQSNLSCALILATAFFGSLHASLIISSAPSFAPSGNAVVLDKEGVITGLAQAENQAKDICVILHHCASREIFVERHLLLLL